MSPFNWFLLLVVVAILLFGFILIVARIARPHSKKMARGQVQLNKKTGSTAPAATGTAGILPVTPSTFGEHASEWFMKYLWSILIVIALVGLVLWGLSSTLGTSSQSLQSPSLKTVWEGTKNYWHWIVLILVILLFLPSVFAKPWLKPLPWFVAITAFMLWGVFPILVGMQDDENPNSQSSQGCSPISNAKVHRCVLNERPQVFTTEQLAYSEALEFCIVRPTGTSYESKKVGPNSFEVRSASGTFPIEYKLLKGNCPDKF